MRFFLRAILGICFAITMTASGGGSSSSTLSSNTTTIAAGTPFAIPANTTVLVPPGTTIYSPNSSGVTINGSNDIANTQAGAVLSVPATATGPADDRVASVQAAGDSV